MYGVVTLGSGERTLQRAEPGAETTTTLLYSYVLVTYVHRVLYSRAGRVEYIEVHKLGSVGTNSHTRSDM